VEQIPACAVSGEVFKAQQGCSCRCCHCVLTRHSSNLTEKKKPLTAAASDRMMEEYRGWLTYLFSVRPAVRVFTYIKHKTLPLPE